MTNVARLFFLYFTINTLKTILAISVEDWSKNDMIINVKKGYTLQRLGAYSLTLAEEVIHTFIPLSNFCILSPQTDVCRYVSTPIDMNMALLTTMTAPRHITQTQSSYNNEGVSRLTSKDVVRVLTEHRPDDIINNAKAIIHFVDNQFYYHRSVSETVATTPATSIIENQFRISCLPST